MAVITHILHLSSRKAMDAPPLSNHCHLEPAYGLAPSWGNGWGGLPVDHWVIGNQQLGGRPLITSTNLALISSPARFLPFPHHAPQSPPIKPPSADLQAHLPLSSCLHTWE